MGYGLWILDEIVTATQGKLHIYSEGAYILIIMEKDKRTVLVLARNNHLFIFAISKSKDIVGYSICV